MDYKELFTPFRIGSMEVKNRIGMSPMGTNSAFTSGRKDAQEIDYFIERAKGGTGVIFLGCQMLNEVLAQGSMEGYLDSFTVLPSLTAVCDGVHRYGAKIVCQISPGTGRNAFPDTLGNPPISSSETPSVFNPDIKCHALTKEEIATMMDGFRFAAGLARDAGFDAIEIHAHAGYLIDQFMSPVWNKRTDEYGGSPENCARFPVEIIQAMKSVVGDKLPVIFRISLDHRFEGGRTMEDSMKLLKVLEEGGVDAFDVDAGCYETLDYIFPPSYLGEACMAYVCEEARKTVKVPIINAGTHNPDTALELIKSGNADIVNFGRGLIADPFMPNKLMTGHPEDVRPCLRCNEFCIGRIWNNHTKLSCAVNIQAMEEERFRIVKTDTPKKVVVIGAGPAGMEAARTAALSGHKVSLYEKSDKLGGTMGDICTAKFKINIKKYTEWFKVQLEKLDVDIHLNTEVSGDEAFLSECDNIIIGCGAIPFTPPISGIDGANVVSILNVHKDQTKIKGDNVVICGGGLSGLDGALEMASELGKKVTVVEMLDECGKDVMFINKITLFGQLAQNGVTLKTGAKVVSISDKAVTVETKDGKEDIPADTVVAAFGMRPVRELAEKIRDKYPTKTRIVGDSMRLGKIGDAVREGFYAGTGIV
ncbi:MAG: NAD(P)/FAD-dependent oxidoreductase [Lachnospiraceae bacterium]|nr:NAD(P)/FAD-dependent oxidoreductase [Lachnospiraceae bacterium]